MGKEVRRVRAGATPAGEQVAYLKDPAVQPLRLTDYAGSLEHLLALLRDRARVFAVKLEAAFSAAEKPGHTFENTLNEVAVLAWKAAECHSMYAFLDNNFKALHTSANDAGSAQPAMYRLLELAALQIVRE